MLDPKNKGRARVRIAVFIVLAIHGVGLLALLMQGCKPSTPPEPAPMVDTNPPPTFEATNVPPVDTNAQTSLGTNPPPPETAPPTTPSANVAPPPLVGGTEYVIAKGDTFSTIAKKFGVSVKALTDANPGVQPTRLQIGQKIQVPPAGAAAAPATTGSVESAAQTYTVKSGDTLTRIAAHYGVSLKALRAANNLKTDSIRVGQKLKIPVKAPAAAPAPVPAPAAAEPAPSSYAAPATPATGTK